MTSLVKNIINIMNIINFNNTRRCFNSSSLHEKSGKCNCTYMYVIDYAMNWNKLVIFGDCFGP